MLEGHPNRARRDVSSLLSRLYDDWRPLLGWKFDPPDGIHVYGVRESPVAAAALHKAGFRSVTAHGHRMSEPCECKTIVAEGSRTGKRYLDAARGEQATDHAVAEGRVEVVITDPADGSRTSFGTLVRRRTCGPYQLRISHDREAKLWWITALGEERLAVIGFHEGRAATCSRLFDRLTPDEIRRAGGPSS